MKRVAILAICSFALVVTHEAPAANDPIPSTCTVKGQGWVSGSVWSAATGGVELASLSSAERAVEMSDFPDDSSKQRVHLRAHPLTPGLRVDGYVVGTALPIVNTKEITVVPSVVSIPAGVTLRLLHPKGAQFEAEPRFPTFVGTRGPIACSALATTSKAKPPVTPASTADYVFRKDSLQLFDDDFAKAFLLHPAKKGVVLAGYETKNGFVHVQFADDVVIDGWARTADVKKLGDDGGYGVGGLGATGLGPTITYQYAQRDTDVLLGADASAIRAGVLEKGARVRAFDAGGGFKRVEVSDAVAPGGKAFHVRSADLGGSPPP